VYVLLQFLERTGPGASELAGLEVSERGTVHALVRRGGVTGALIVTLEGRPVESYLRLVGTNGSVYADYVRSTVQRHIGPGTSGIDKLFAPYRLARQLVGGTTRAMARRFLKRQRSYPGLAELFEAFYASVRGGPAPLSSDSILETTRIWERVARALERVTAGAIVAAPPESGRRVVVTGGTGFVGREIVRALAEAGDRVRVLARRAPPAWERVDCVEYVVADLGKRLPPSALEGAELVIHAAAETAGGWEDHQRNSIDATEHVLRAAAAAGATRLIHVSSLAVIGGHGVLRDDSPLLADSRGSGPYVWGKLESERLARRLGPELGVAVKVVRPGAVVDYEDFDPPGRLGKRLGNIYVAVGAPGHRLGVVDVRFNARAIRWIGEHFDEAPAVLNLLDPELPTKRELLRQLRRNNPDLSVVWLPTPVLVPLSWLAIALQKALRPGKPAINVARVFAVQRYDTSGIAALPVAEAPLTSTSS
jgi:nucleoside-diphosphate-sugar epimerase